MGVSAPRPTPRLILASQSPRRHGLLQLLCLPFDVIPGGVDETAVPADLEPASLARWLAERKAEDVAARYPEAVAIGADTIVVLGDEVMGKPIDLSDARRML